VLAEAITTYAGGRPQPRVNHLHRPARRYPGPYCPAGVRRRCHPLPSSCRPTTCPIGPDLGRPGAGHPAAAPGRPRHPARHPPR
jgi:hypothetical protein